MSPPAGFFFRPYLCSLPVFWIFVYVFVCFSSILSSLDIFLFVSLYAYILHWFLVKGSSLSMQHVFVLLFVQSCNSLWLMFCLLVVDIFLFFYCNTWFLGAADIFLWVLPLYYYYLQCISWSFVTFLFSISLALNPLQFSVCFFLFDLFRLTYLLLFLLLLLLLQLLENIYVKNENACYYCYCCWFE